MTSGDPRHRTAANSQKSTPSRLLRPFLILVAATVLLTKVPIATAHGETATGGITQELGVYIAIVGVALLGGFVLLKRTRRITPTQAIYGVFAGIAVTALGAIIFEGLSPDPAYTTSSMPFPRSWYRPLGLGTGLTILVVSVLLGRLRWPTRPRYSFLGILMGLWIAYPYLIPGPASDTHPLGYAIVLGTPILIGYVLWTDAWGVLRPVLEDPVARRFGIGVTAVLALFFMTMTGYLSFFPEEGAAHETTVVVLPVIYQLVSWPTLEIALPHIPLFLAVSPGLVVVVGTLSVLVGLNAAIVARHWRVEEPAGTAEGATGSVAIVGTCTCGCCGPLVAKVAVLVAGPSIAAPIYWIFVDTASPLSVLFIAGSFLLFTGSLLYSIDSARQPDGSSVIVPSS